MIFMFSFNKLGRGYYSIVFGALRARAARIGVAAPFAWEKSGVERAAPR